MQEVDFYKLPRAVQDRFIASAYGAGEPKPLVQARGPRDARVDRWLVASVACGLLLVGLCALGLGRLDSSLARQSSLFIAGYAAIIGGATLCALQALVAARHRSGLPFPARVYLFPVGVIDATSRRVRAHRLQADTRWQHASGHFRITFGEGASAPSFAFPLRDEARAGYIERGLLAARERMAQATATSNGKLLYAVDPLVDIGVANPFAPTTPHIDRAPWWLTLRALVAPLVGVALGSGLWFGRNVVSDALMLRQARRESTAQAYRAYLSSGGQSRLVREVLLPRAELADVVRRGGLAPIERFAQQRPHAEIQGEIDAALRNALLRELELAKASGTVAALREFARLHPSSQVGGELQRSVHALYQAALVHYRSEAAKDPQVMAFVERLLGSLERNGPTVELRFRRKASRTLRAADRSVKKSAFFMGLPSLPSQYFDERRSRERELLVATAVRERFAASFPPDMMTIELGAPLTEADPGGSASPKVPVILVEHTPEVSGGSYLSTNPRGVFVGLGLIFDVTFSVPEDARPLTFRLSAWRPPDIRSAKKHDAFEAAVYESMATTGYVQFAERYLATFFARERARAQNERDGRL